MTPSHVVRITAAALALAALPALADTWNVPGDFTSIQAAIDSPLVFDGDTIRVGPGEFAGALVTKSVEIKGEGDAVISAGPLHGSGLVQGFRLLAGSTGTTISHLTFTVDLDIMNGAAVNDVTVTQCTFENAVQAISNWRGSGWEITHNQINDLRCRNGGGIGILIADYTGGIVTDNLVSHNKITGTLHVDPSDLGGYSGTGIVLYADFRWDREGATNIAFNRILKNTVGLESDTPGVVDVFAIEVTDTLDDPNAPAILEDNTIGFNDWRDTVNYFEAEPIPVLFTPENLVDANAVSRNLGDNRGHGLHPSMLFSPDAD